jgi:hypothetical protein
LGYGVKKDLGRKEKLRELSFDYKEFRRENKDLLSRATRPSKSNLTLTGQMLDSLRIRKFRRGLVTIGPYGRRRAAGFSPTKLTNPQLTEILEANGRPYLHLSRLEVKQLQRFYRKTFGDLVNKYRF